MRGGSSPRRFSIISRPPRTRVLAVGEGKETEPNYLEAMRDEDEVRERYSLNVEAGPGLNPKAIVEHAISVRARKKSSFDEVWCILDVEGRDKAASLLAARKLAAAAGIRLVTSNPSFEVWLLSHFEYTTREYLAAQIEGALNQKWRIEFGCDYDKSGRIYGNLRPLLPVALVNSRRCAEVNGNKNSSTAVVEVVARLMPSLLRNPLRREK